MVFTISFGPLCTTFVQLVDQLPTFLVNRVDLSGVRYPFNRGYERFALKQPCIIPHTSATTVFTANRWASAIIAANDGDTRCRTVKED
jgi:hypothetical protein